ncbi:reverse transcriptase domain-containing protein [Tanacetum coccineum]
MCDASDFALGAVLGQRHEKHFRPIHYASKTMNEAESRYTMTEKEIISLQRKILRRIALMGLPPSRVDFDVVTRKELKNLAADHLSRLENPHKNELDPKEINEKFPLETLSSIAVLDASTPWFADIANYRGNFVDQRECNPAEKKFLQRSKVLISGKIPFCLKSVRSSYFNRCVFGKKHDILLAATMVHRWTSWG